MLMAVLDMTTRAGAPPSARIATKHLAATTRVAVSGDGTVHTQPVVVRTPGCYTYYEELTPLTTPTQTVRTPLGIHAESTVVRTVLPPRPLHPGPPLAKTGAQVSRLLSVGLVS